jgi:polysaccharide export outer membrane protein
MRKIVSAVIVAIFISCIPATAQVNTRKVTPPSNQTKPTEAANPTPANPTAASPTAATPAVEEYRIGAQDLLDVSVWDMPQFDLKVVVRPDGKIGIKLLSDVQAAGLTTKEIEMRIAEGLKDRDIVQKPRVTVIVLEIRSKVVTVTGFGARNTGPYAIGGPMRVVDLLARAGLNDFAKRSEIAVIRDEGNNSFTRFPFDYDAYMRGKYSQNILLRSGDTVIVP